MANLLMYFHLATHRGQHFRRKPLNQANTMRGRVAYLPFSSASDLPGAISSFDDKSEWLVTEPILSPLTNVVESLSAFGRRTDFSASNLHVVMQLKPISADNFWTSSTYVTKDNKRAN